MALTNYQWFGELVNITLDGSTYSAAGSAYKLYGTYAWNRYRIWSFTLQNADVYIQLPDARDLPLGGPIWYFDNLTPGDSYEIFFTNQSDAVVGVLKSKDYVNRNHCVVTLLDNSTAAGVWGMLGLQKNEPRVLQTS
jgi:hypothetical protein